MNITLIGMAGVGKSHVGARLAARLGYAFVDLDDVITSATGMPPAAFIKQYGEEEFLRIEDDAAMRLTGMRNTVCAPGGSIVYCERAMMRLRDESFVVYLHADAAHIRSRSNPETRGIVGLAAMSFEELLEQRDRLYRAASDCVISVASRPADEIVGDIVRRIPHLYRGSVERGERRGTTLGFPTANVHIAQSVGGIFAGRVRFDGNAYPAAIYADPRTEIIEAHLLDYAGELYGKEIAIELCDKIRSDRRFASEEEARTTIAEDVRRIRAYFQKV